jgi:hypothetical protein
MALSVFKRLQTLSTFTNNVLSFILVIQHIIKLWRLAASWLQAEETDRIKETTNQAEK